MSVNVPFRPMLAVDLPLEQYRRVFKIKGEMFASVKLDGIRAIVLDGKLVSRSLKPIPNHHIRKALSVPELDGFDGELIVGEPSGEGVFNRTTSAVMSWAGEPDFRYYIFDLHNAPGSYEERLEALELRVGLLSDRELAKRIHVVPQSRIDSVELLTAVEKVALEHGYEGLIVRDPKAPYKHGRSTPQEGWLLKLKRFVDSEGVIIGIKEGYSNQNAAEISELGLIKRSSSKAGKVPMGTAGAVVVRDEKYGWEVDIGTGFTPAQRQEIWDNREQLLGKIAKYSFFPVGSGESARFPTWIGLRDPRDMSE